VIENTGCRRVGCFEKYDNIFEPDIGIEEITFVSHSSISLIKSAGSNGRFQDVVRPKTQDRAQNLAVGEIIYH
jgi:hypothetical protein